MRSASVKLVCLICTIFLFKNAQAQNDLKIPINALSAATDASKPMILYVTGDGGWNSFSSALGANLAAKGYPVASLNAKSFFWKKKTPQQAGLAVATMIKNYAQSWNKTKVLLVGYSLGADVLPFVYQNLPQNLKDMVQGLVLLSPSGTTDFEVHLTYAFSGSAPNSATTLNNITGKKITILTGGDENDFPFTKMTNKNYTHITLPGGHHYDGDEELVADYMLKGI